MKLLILLAIFLTTSAIKFECEYRNDLYRIGKIYTCYVASYSEEQNKILTAFNGTHLNGYSNSDVRGIQLFVKHGKTVDYFPRGFEKFFPYLNVIDVWFKKITKLDGDELENYKNLIWFGIQHSSLEFVPGNLFSNNKKIKVINMYGNNIKYVGEGLLDGLNGLFYASFAHNTCIDERAETPAQIEQLKRNLRKNCKVPKN
jgi:hypothetical protein